jgi:hypothetical protein
VCRSAAKSATPEEREVFARLAAGFEKAASANDDVKLRAARSTAPRSSSRRSSFRVPGIGTIPGGFEYPIGAGGRDGRHLTIRGIMSIIGSSRVDGRVLGFFLFLFYTFQQVYRPPVIFDRTLDARAAAKRQKAGDW